MDGTDPESTSIGVGFLWQRQLGSSPSQPPQPSDSCDSIEARIAALPETERRILFLLLTRLERGLATYGPWDLTSRDWAQEAAEEALDGLHYVAALMLALSERVGKP